MRLVFRNRETKIEQLLTEARGIMPGGQALLGFQFVATLTKAFETLPQAITSDQMG
ncbi:hypothetical protein ACFIOY_29350 [Bradyrhizobium sp. TZ2]